MVDKEAEAERQTKTDTHADAGESALFSRPLSDADLRAARRGLALKAEATEEERQRIAQRYELLALEHLSYSARLEPFGRSGWRLSGRIRAQATQSCVLTLNPAPAALDEPFLRLWSPDAPEGGAGAEATAGRMDLMALDPEFAAETGWSDAAGALAPDAGGAAPGDGEAQLEALPAAQLEAEEVERTPDPIDPAAAALETFTLALDPYPRAPGAAFDGATHGPAGSPPLTDEAARPFAGLGALRSRLAQSETDAAAETADAENAEGTHVTGAGSSGESAAGPEADTPEKPEKA